jgi:hypothetical protein
VPSVNFSEKELESLAYATLDADSKGRDYATVLDKLHHKMNSAMSREKHKSPYSPEAKRGLIGESLLAARRKLYQSKPA